MSIPHFFTKPSASSLDPNGCLSARPSHPGVQPSNWLACGPAALPGLQRLRSPHGGARGGCHWGWRIFLVKVDKKKLGFRCFYEARFEVWGPGFYFYPLHPVLRMAIQQFVGTVLGTHGWSYLVLNHTSPSIEWTWFRAEPSPMAKLTKSLDGPDCDRFDSSVRHGSAEANSTFEPFTRATVALLPS